MIFQFDMALLLILLLNNLFLCFLAFLKLFYSVIVYFKQKVKVKELVLQEEVLLVIIKLKLVVIKGKVVQG